MTATDAMVSLNDGLRPLAEAEATFRTQQSIAMEAWAKKIMHDLYPDYAESAEKHRETPEASA